MWRSYIYTTHIVIQIGIVFSFSSRALCWARQFFMVFFFINKNFILSVTHKQIKIGEMIWRKLGAHIPRDIFIIPFQYVWVYENDKFKNYRQNVFLFFSFVNVVHKMSSGLKRKTIFLSLYVFVCNSTVSAFFFLFRLLLLPFFYALLLNFCWFFQLEHFFPFYIRLKSGGCAGGYIDRCTCIIMLPKEYLYLYCVYPQVYRCTFSVFFFLLYSSYYDVKNIKTQSRRDVHSCSVRP